MHSNRGNNGIVYSKAILWFPVKVRPITCTDASVILSEDTKCSFVNYHKNKTPQKLFVFFFSLFFLYLIQMPSFSKLQLRNNIQFAFPVKKTKARQVDQHPAQVDQHPACR